jgi:glutaredoxin
MQNLLFFSNHCEYSLQFINILQKSHIDIVGINVNKNLKTKKRHELVYKYNIKEVPTVIIEGKKLVGKDAFMWLHSEIQASGITVNNSRDRPEPSCILPAATNTRNSKEIEGVDVEKIKIRYEVINEEEEGSSRKITPESEYPGVKSKKYYDKDALKKQQKENEYHRLLKERDTATL